jgi:small subunit ribosomal protein S6
MHKAHYVLMNIEVDAATLTELEHAFKFNDAVLRHLIVAMREAVVAPSPMMKEDKARSLTEKPADKSADRGGDKEKDKGADKPAERATTDAAA